MIPLNQVQIQILKERLRVMRHDLLALLERQRERRGGMTAGRVNLRDANKLVLVEAALQRLELGQFGGCTGCDRRIGIRMLVDDPCAVHCRTCAKDREQAATAAELPGSGMLPAHSAGSPRSP
ncbi:MAG TPA: hypothetical protein VLI06_04550 [Solimonas sp.]|nr:hypothetical protein [Solimonas sp.]